MNCWIGLSRNLTEELFLTYYSRTKDDKLKGDGHQGSSRKLYLAAYAKGFRKKAYHPLKPYSTRNEQGHSLPSPTAPLPTQPYPMLNLKCTLLASTIFAMTLVQLSLLELSRKLSRCLDRLNYPVRLHFKRCSWPEFQRAHAVRQEPVLRTLSILAGADFAFVVSESAPGSSALEEEAALTTSEEFT